MWTLITYLFNPLLVFIKIVELFSTNNFYGTNSLAMASTLFFFYLLKKKKGFKNHLVHKGRDYTNSPMLILSVKIEDCRLIQTYSLLQIHVVHYTNTCTVVLSAL